MKKWWLKNQHRVIDFFILLVSIIFTLAIEGKLVEYFSFAKKHPMWTILILGVFWIYLFWRKIKYEVLQDDLQEKLNEIKEENKFYTDLISSFKYQISEPLENKLFEVSKKLKFDNNYRITVYTYTKNRFFSIGRYSHNEEYRKFGRIAIRDQNELLFKAWQNGNLTQTLKPDVRRKMKSQKISIHYLYEKNDELPEKNKFGVVVFETTNKKDKKFNNGNLDSCIKEISEFFHSSWNIRQDLNFAMQEGL